MELETRNYWICVTNPYNWQIIKAKNLWGTDDRYEKTMKSLFIRDKLVVYTTGLKKWKSVHIPNVRTLKRLSSSIVGIYSVVEGYKYDNTPIGWKNRDGKDETYPYRVKIDPILTDFKPIPLGRQKEGQPYRDELWFIADKSKSWYSLVYASMIRIQEDDYDKIWQWASESRVDLNLLRLGNKHAIRHSKASASKKSRETTVEQYSSLSKWMKDFKSMEYYSEWSNFILHSVLSSEEKTLKEIYEAIKQRNPEICVDYITYWGKPKWKHMVRSVLDGLMKEGLAKSVRRGRWVRLK